MTNLMMDGADKGDLEDVCVSAFSLHEGHQNNIDAILSWTGC